MDVANLVKEPVKAISVTEIYQCYLSDSSS